MTKYKVIKKCNNRIIQLKKDEDIEGYLVLSLAKTALWLSKCAEYYKNKKIQQTDDIKEKQKYINMIKSFYELKLKIVKLLLKTNQVDIKFYKPKKIRHAYSNIVLCDKHREIFESQNEYKLIQFFYHHFYEINKCEECSVDRIKNYYCLFCLTIMSGNVSIKLNMPYTSLNAESEVDKKFEIIEEKPLEGFYYENKQIVKTKWILDDTTFSKDELKKNFKELKELLNNNNN